jgi:hypothetical protein
MAAILAFPPSRLHTNPAPWFSPSPPIVVLSKQLEEEHSIPMRQRIIITLALAVLALVAATASA